ncbi:hypothetical protein ACN9MF_28405 [Methylobacterium fujisawaense]|uniref:hypothetical protein n=1 Tax=Methylobacterium fujisawaense TaxID=107400 RepID=UPI003CF8FC1C
MARAEKRAATAAAKLRRPSAARRRTKPASVTLMPASAETFAVGAWPIAALRNGQCRFACTPHGARPEQHRFCGEPTALRAGKPTSWCAVHLARIFDTSRRVPDGEDQATEPPPELAETSSRRA